MPTRRPIAGVVRTSRAHALPADRRSAPLLASKYGVKPLLHSDSASDGVRAIAQDRAPAPLFGYTFRNPSLLSLALTHSSLAYESHRDGATHAGDDNERLEFIGDAVLGLVVAESLYRRFPALREGELTRMRASLVSRRNLAGVAQTIGLGPMLRLGRGEEHSGGQRKPALLADALEAVIAAMYLDGGMAPARAFVEKHIVGPAEPSLSGLLQSPASFAGAIGDYKSALQEHLQASGAGQPHYILAEESGPDHQKRFRIEVRVDAPGGSSTRLAEAEGTTKKQAQQEAARLALEALNILDDPAHTASFPLHDSSSTEALP